MKKLIIHFILCLGFVSCNFSSSSNQNEVPQKENKSIPMTTDEVGDKLSTLNKIYSFNNSTLYKTDESFSPPKKNEYNVNVTYIKINNKLIKLLDSEMHTIDIYNIIHKSNIGSLDKDNNACSLNLIGQNKKFKNIKIWIITGISGNSISWMTISYQKDNISYKWMLNN